MVCFARPFFFGLGLLLLPQTSIGQEANSLDTSARESIELALDVAHCMTYFEVAADSQTMDGMDKEIAELGRTILDLSLMLGDVDMAIVSDVSAVIRPHVEEIPGDQLLALYDEYCDGVSERFSD